MPQESLDTRYGSLSGYTRDLLLNRPRTLTIAEIARQTGLGVFWIQHFAKDVHGNQGVNSVQTLYEFLSGKKLTF